jgi:glycogen operon protein
LRDLVSYNEKHNADNGEQNRDGADDNRSWNSGAEGPTDDAAVLELRAARSRAMLATVMLSLGVPMLLGGDELGRSQSGNNNAYCQDNSLSWYDWDAVDVDLLAFTRRLIALRRAHPALRQRRYLSGAQPREIGWYTPAGTAMTDADWTNPQARSVAIYINGVAEPDLDPRGRPLLDDGLLILVNGWWEPLDFTLPDLPHQHTWRRDLDTAAPTVDGQPVPADTPVTVAPRSLIFLTSPAAEASPA